MPLELPAEVRLICITTGIADLRKRLCRGGQGMSRTGCSGLGEQSAEAALFLRQKTLETASRHGHLTGQRRNRPGSGWIARQEVARLVNAGARTSTLMFAADDV